MYRSTMFLLAVIAGVMTVGCAKNSGSIVSNDPFAANGDPFQAVANHSKESKTFSAAKQPVSTQPPGWSRTQPMYSQSKTEQPAGMANTSLRFQASAPMPEITAEKPVAHKPMPVPTVQTVEATPPSGIQHAQYFNGQSQSNGVTPASFESSMPVIRPRNAPAMQESPVTLEMPVFANEKPISSVEPNTVTAPTMQSGADNEWWNK
ncbi:MAG: hypothetical protein P8M30_06075 [Planctomycetaceae bacterium]|jgi:hypothetical protein|nr:hypothetical protein [Planctomycetaceae bacterium]MDG2388869.1 hypothetical protein [Planctomycetaceae bacterium]